MVVIEPLATGLGAEVRGVTEPSPQCATMLRNALVEHHLLVIRARPLSPPEQIAFASIFGVPEIVGRRAHTPEYPAIYRTSNQPNDGNLNVGRYWHADGTMLKNASAISIWHVIQHPTDGGDTLFTDMHRAFDELPGELRNSIENLQMISSTGSMHPVVQTHPVTRRKALYTSLGMTRAFAGLGNDETKSMLQRLANHLNRPGGHYRHKWQVGDVVVADNFSIAHKATATDSRFGRVLHRVSIRGGARRSTIAQRKNRQGKRIRVEPPYASPDTIIWLRSNPETGVLPHVCFGSRLCENALAGMILL